MKRLLALGFMLILVAAFVCGCGSEEIVEPAEESICAESPDETPAVDAEGTEAAQTAAPDSEAVQDENVVMITSEEIDLRQVAVDYMKAMAAVEWTCTVPIDYNYKVEGLEYTEGVTYLGMVYNNNRTGLEAFEAIIDENGNYASENTSWNTSPGNTCATSIEHAWQQVCPSIEYTYAVDFNPWYTETGVLPVGDIDWSMYDGKNTQTSIVNAINEYVIYDAYAMTHPGDALTRYLDTSGHAMMITQEPEVTRDEWGNLDPDNSYLYITEQNSAFNDLRGTRSSWKVDYPMSFSAIYSNGYLPVTSKEFQEGRTPAPVYETEDLPTAETVREGLSGTVKCNYCLNRLTALVFSGDEVVKEGEVNSYARITQVKEIKGFDVNDLPSGTYRFVLEAETGIGVETLCDFSFDI